MHLHEPLAPSPALAALRHAQAITAATFHRAEPLAGVAFLRPLVDRALARADLRFATTEAGRDALSEILPGPLHGDRARASMSRCSPPRPRDGPPGLVLVARGRDRVGVRFALGVLRGIDLDTVGPVTLLGPADAPWRTRAAVPKALRDRVSVVPDAGPDSRAAAFRSGRIALIATPEDVLGPAMHEAMASGCAVLAPLGTAVDEAAVHGVDALVLPPFTRDAWTSTVTELVRDPSRRRALGTAARARAATRTWDDDARDLEAAYRAAIALGARGPGAGEGRVLADLHVRPGPDLTPAQIVAACAERGVAVVAVAGAGDLSAARATEAVAGGGLTVVIGQEVTTSEGHLVGLYLSDPVADGLTARGTADAIHAQGGLVMVPHTGAPRRTSCGASAGPPTCTRSPRPRTRGRAAASWPCSAAWACWWRGGARPRGPRTWGRASPSCGGSPTPRGWSRRSRMPVRRGPGGAARRASRLCAAAAVAVDCRSPETASCRSNDHPEKYRRRQ